MAFSVQKAILFSVTMFVVLAALMSLANTNWPLPVTLFFAIVGALAVGIVVGFLTRDGTIEVAGASIVSIEVALGSAWSLRGFKSHPVDGGILYRRGFGILGDSFAVYTTATGVRLEGPCNIIRMVKARAAA